jgi:hypothetical protein
MTESDREFFIRRSAEERSAAERASHPTAKKTHLDLAERYAAAADAALPHLHPTVIVEEVKSRQA